jgi:hypothetical protein
MFRRRVAPKEPRPGAALGAAWAAAFADVTADVVLAAAVAPTAGLLVTAAAMTGVTAGAVVAAEALAVTGAAAAGAGAVATSARSESPPLRVTVVCADTRPAPAPRCPAASGAESVDDPAAGESWRTGERCTGPAPRAVDWLAESDAAELSSAQATAGAAATAIPRLAAAAPTCSQRTTGRTRRRELRAGAEISAMGTLLVKGLRSPVLRNIDQLSDWYSQYWSRRHIF